MYVLAIHPLGGPWVLNHWKLLGKMLNKCVSNLFATSSRNLPCPWTAGRFFLSPEFQKCSWYPTLTTLVLLHAPVLPQSRLKPQRIYLLTSQCLLQSLDGFGILPLAACLAAAGNKGSVSGPQISLGKNSGYTAPIGPLLRGSQNSSPRSLFPLALHSTLSCVGCLHAAGPGSTYWSVFIYLGISSSMGFPGSSTSKESACNVGDLVWCLGW